MTDCRFPIHIDFSAYLAAEGVTLATLGATATITILSTDWQQVGDPDGKPEYETADKVAFALGDNATNRQTIFASLLANCDGHNHNAEWFYNQISFAIQKQMLPHVHPVTRSLRKEHHGKAS